MKNFLKNLILTAFGLLAATQVMAQPWVVTGNNIGTNSWLGGTSANTNPLVIKTNGIERMRILGTNGNVGIGISAPTQRLHLAGAAMISGASPFGGPMLLFSDDVSINQFPNGRWGIEYVKDNVANNSITDGGLNFWRPFSNPGNPAGANWDLFLKDDGKVGIGLDPAGTCPNCPNGPFPAGYRLYVKGGILTEQVKVAIYGTSSWADYVFEEGYDLLPLDKVDAFVKENGHLPNIPSAKEIVADGGFELKEMAVKHQEKIEEIYLHLIELNKKVAALEAENAALKQAVPTGGK